MHGDNPRPQTKHANTPTRVERKLPKVCEHAEQIVASTASNNGPMENGSSSQ
jgi:hypothetical protein